MDDRAKPVTTEAAGICAKHGQYIAHVFEIFGVKIETRCPQCEAEETYREQQEKQLAIREQYQSGLQARGIEQEFYDATLDNYVAENNAERAALEVSRKLASGEVKRSCFLEATDAVRRTWDAQ